jgi:uncharacterized protein with HEPN domain
MHEEEIADCLALMLDSIKLIESRFQKVGSPGEFVQSSEGITLLDAIAMRLQVIGESVRKIQKMDSSFLDPYSDVEWNKIARFRDLVSHHYDQVDHEIVYDICKVHIPTLKLTLQKVPSDISAPEKNKP